MEGAILIIIGCLVVSILMWILLSTFVSFINSAGLSNITVNDKVDPANASKRIADTVSYKWAGDLFVVVYVLAASLLPIGVLVYVISHYVKK